MCHKKPDKQGFYTRENANMRMNVKYAVGNDSILRRWKCAQVVDFNPVWTGGIQEELGKGLDAPLRLA